MEPIKEIRKRQYFALSLVVGVIAIIIFLAIHFFSSINNTPVEKEIVKTVVSPNGQYIAVAFITRSNVMKTSMPGVAVAHYADDFEKEINKVFEGRDSEFIDIEWENNRTLIIKHELRENSIFLQTVKKNGIQIRYLNVVK